MIIPWLARSRPWKECTAKKNTGTKDRPWKEHFEGTKEFPPKQSEEGESLERTVVEGLDTACLELIRPQPRLNRVGADRVHRQAHRHFAPKPLEQIPPCPQKPT